MTQAEHHLLFAAKLLALEEPLQCWRHYLLKYGGTKDMTPQFAAENSNQRNLFDEMKGERLTLDDLRALLRAADEGKWWPTKESLSRHLYFKERRLDDWQGEDILQKILDSVTLIRALVLGDAAAVGERDAVAARERTAAGTVEVTMFIFPDSHINWQFWESLIDIISHTCPNMA